MITSLKLTNFRNFQTREFFFSDNKNYILGENGKGKTNILESLSLLTSSSITGIGFENLVKNGADFFHIEMSNVRGDTISIFFDALSGKKKYAINAKSISRKKFGEISLKSVLFSPIHMNMMYLSPSLRRDFLDNLLSNSFSEYAHALKEYKKSLANRNKILKNISKNKSSIDEIHFWNDDFIQKCKKIYEYRNIIINYYQINSHTLLSGFDKKVSTIDFAYISKIDFNLPLEKQIKNYLDTNLQKDVILRSTTIGPHRDDFSITINDQTPLIDFASRGEVKSTILELKKLEIAFIEKHTLRKPILIIDDLLSELDDMHKNNFINSLKGYQTFISGIKLELEKDDNVIQL